jgi:transposase
VIEIDINLDLWMVSVAERVRTRRLSDEEGRQLQQIVRPGTHGSIRVRRALIIIASASGTNVPAIAPLVQADEDTVRHVIHRVNEIGLACLDPQWAGAVPRISPDETAYIVTTALTRPEKLGMPFTRWNIRKLADYLAANPVRMVNVSRERLRQILRRHKVSSNDPHVEGIHRPRPGGQARPHRGRDQKVPEPMLRVRPVRAAVAAPRRHLGPPHPSDTATGHPTHAPTASATSTAATASATTNSGV